MSRVWNFSAGPCVLDDAGPRRGQGSAVGSRRHVEGRHGIRCHGASHGVGSAPLQHRLPLGWLRQGPQVGRHIWCVSPRRQGRLHRRRFPLAAGTVCSLRQRSRNRSSRIEPHLQCAELCDTVHGVWGMGERANRR